jgi:molybdate transport system substrate-binding protein
MAIARLALPGINQMRRVGKLWAGLVLAPFILMCDISGSLSAHQGIVRRGILVSAAASLKDVIGTIAAAFEKVNPEIKLSFNFGASGQLKIQIENGAPVDVFLCAATADMDVLEQKGLIYRETRQNVAGNALVLIRSRDRGPRFQKAEELAGDNIIRIAVGNPLTVPAGCYAKEALVSGGIYDRLKNKLVLGENVRQVLDYVARGEADAGFVYRSDAMIEPRVVTVETLAANRHSPILYPAAVVMTGGDPGDAKKFVAYLRSEEARSIFRKYGFE